MESTRDQDNDLGQKIEQKGQTCLNLKRQLETTEETKKYQKSVKKRPNLELSTKMKDPKKYKLDFTSLLQLLQAQSNDNFPLQFSSVESQINDYNVKNQKDEPIVFPDPCLEPLKQFKNELLTRTIEIMSNKNQKIQISIHEGLYKSNTSHTKNELLMQEKWKQIPNLCDFRMKNQYSQSIQFIREYKSGYVPILMQKRNEEEIVQQERKDLNQSPTKSGCKDKTRNHFIRKQQSTLTLPRTCGVSYIKPSQSVLTQKAPFQPLPPLIFQGSTSCSIGLNPYQNNFQVDLTQNEKQLINKFNTSLESAWLSFIISDEEQMRDLLLNKRTKKAQVGFVQGIQNLWPLFVQGSFILILISPQPISAEKQVWFAFQNKLSFFKIGILSKKSTSGKKAFLKSIKTQTSDTISVISQQTKNIQLHDVTNPPQQEQKKVSSTMDFLEEELKDNRTVVTMSLRLEMYVEENDWKERFTKQNKEVLNEIIIGLKDKLEKKSIKIISERFQLQKEKQINVFEQKFDFLRKPIVSQESIVENKQFLPSLNGDTLAISSFLLHQNNNELATCNKKILLSHTNPASPSGFLSHSTNDQAYKRSLKFPIYYISTRDSFAFDLIQKKTILKRQNGRQYTRIDYYFYPDNVPTNFGSEYRKLFPQLDVGVTAYHEFYSQEQLKDFEKNTFELQNNAFKNKFLQMTVQPSIVSTKIKRTKFFFGYRYMWTRCQLSEPCSYVGAGVRKDVAPTPEWTKRISDEMVKENIVEKDFINSVAINVYHDGKQGLAQHFDDAVRFKQPIFTLRLFSDARLSFGSQFYGFCNGAFIIPLPRGCMLVMQQNSYAANGVKHCVRPCDMTGKSAAVILRQMHQQVVSQASKYDELIDFPAWLSCLSSDENAITYAQQKRLEAEQIMKGKIE